MMVKNRRSRARRALTGGLAASALVVFGSGVLPAGAADPVGNNGTVKIDGTPFDSHPDNQPHVGCRFQVDFYGFDEGAFNATVTFAVHPPTGTATILTDTVFVGEDPAGGGTDVDAQRTYNLASALSAYTPHPIQGYHVKLTVAAPGAGDSIATKYKVFWVGPCGYASS